MLSFFVMFLVVELNKLLDRACSDQVTSHYRKAEKLLDRAVGIKPATFANLIFTNEEYSVEVDDLYNFARSQYGQYAQYL